MNDAISGPTPPNTDRELAEKIYKDFFSRSVRPPMERFEEAITTHLTAERKQYQEALKLCLPRIICHKRYFSERSGKIENCEMCLNCKAITLIQPLLKK